jgi:membrane protein
VRRLVAGPAHAAPAGAPGGVALPARRAGGGRTRDEAASNMPDVSTKTIVKRVVKRLAAARVTEAAGALTYSIVMAIVPSILVVFALLGIFVDQPAQAVHDVERFLQVDPNGGVGNFLESFLTNISATGGAPTLLGFGTLTALWAFSGAMSSLTGAVNRVWEREDTRSFVVRRLLAVAMAVVTAIVSVVTFGALALSAGASGYVGRELELSGPAETALRFAPYVVLFVVIALYLAIVYWISPDKEFRAWHWITVGALTATLAWLLATAAFAVYVVTVASYNKVYGSLAGIVIGLFWLYLTNIAILLGAAVDAELERATPAVRDRP